MVPTSAAVCCFSHSHQSNHWGGVKNGFLNLPLKGVNAQVIVTHTAPHCTVVIVSPTSSDASRLVTPENSRSPADCLGFFPFLIIIIIIITIVIITIINTVTIIITITIALSFLWVLIWAEKVCCCDFQPLAKLQLEMSLIFYQHLKEERKCSKVWSQKIQSEMSLIFLNLKKKKEIIKKHAIPNHLIWSDWCHKEERNHLKLWSSQKIWSEMSLMASSYGLRSKRLWRAVHPSCPC